MNDNLPDPPVLWTRNVFLDTEEFFRQNFQFRSPPFSRLKDLCGKRKIALIIPEITRDEVKKKMKERIIESLQPILSARKKAYVLKNSRLQEVLDMMAPIKADQVISDMHLQLDEYLLECKAEVIPVSKANASAVFNSYFSLRPPFSEGKKKCEFPDAFAIESCLAWCNEKSQGLYVVSGDSDHQKACDTVQQFRHFAKLAEFLSFYNSAEEHLSKSATARFEQNLTQISEQIMEEITKGNFFTDDLIDAEVESVDVKGVDLNDWYLIDIDDTSATFEVQTSYRIRAEIDYLETDDSYWDKEEGGYLFSSRSCKSFTIRDNLAVIVYIETDDCFQTVSSIVSSVSSHMGTIRLRVDDGDRYE
jgi:hypothetical protein